jgi:probable rRNA maturation factor
MNILLDNRCKDELPLGRVEELARFVLEREGLPTDIELSLSFVEEDEMARLNAEYRGLPQATDVLSFPLDDPWHAFSDTPVSLIGDIVINPGKARERALAEDVTLEEEFWILVIHGILHLIGFDHVEAADAAAMEKREDEHFLHWGQKVVAV